MPRVAASQPGACGVGGKRQGTAAVHNASEVGRAACCAKRRECVHPAALFSDGALPVTIASRTAGAVPPKRRGDAALQTQARSRA